MEDLIKVLCKTPKTFFQVYIHMYKPSICREVSFHFSEGAFCFSKELFQFAGNLSHFEHHFRHYFLGCVPQLYRNTDNTTLTSQPLNVMYTNNPSFPSVCWMRGSRQQKRVLLEQRQWEECPRKCRNNWKSWRLVIYFASSPHNSLQTSYHIVENFRGY